MNLITTGVIHKDESGQYLLVVLRGVFDLTGVIRGTESRLKDLASILLVLREEVFTDTAAMMCGEKSMLTVSRRSTKHLDKALIAIDQAGVDAVEWSRWDVDEEQEVGPEMVSSSIHA